MTFPRAYDPDWTWSPWEQAPRINEDACDWAWFTLLPEDDDEPERTFRVWLAAAGDSDWEITGIEEDTPDGFTPVPDDEYDEIHELALNDQGVISQAEELWL